MALSLSCSIKLSAQESQKTVEKLPKGINLCHTLFDYLSNNNFNPREQSLIKSNQNDFPYNIYIENIGKNSSNNDKNNVLFIFEMESAFAKKEVLKRFLDYLKNTENDFNATILFAYGEAPKFTKQGMIYGTQIYLDDYYFEDEFTALFINLNCEKSKITSSSNRMIAPGQLVKGCLNAFLKNHLPVTNRFIFLSQLYTLSFHKDRILDTFFMREIPAIKIEFDGSLKNETVFSTLYDISSSINDSNWDQHFILYNLFGSFQILTEKSILTILFVIIFTLLLFIFVFGYINSFIKFEAWKQIRYIWYAAPVTFILISAGFQVGKLFYLLFNPATPFGKIFLLVWLQLFFSLIFISILFFVLSKFNHNYTDRSVDYLVLLTTFINQSFFSFFDISLFPMFLLIFTAAFSTIFFRKFFSHLYLFIILLALLFPYTFSFLGSFESSQIHSYLLSSQTWQFSIAMIITPIALLYLRIVTKFRETHPNSRSIALFVIVYTTSIIFTQTEICLISVPLRNKTVTKTSEPLLVSSEHKFINLTHTDKIIFDDKIRTLNIKLEKQPELCDVQIFAPSAQPLKYSDYDFELINGTSSYFLIPQNPPSELTFSYGTIDGPSFVKISAIFEDENSEEDYILEERIFPVSEAE